MAINTLKIKLKTCCKCLKPRKIWKRVENKLWCKPCYYKQFPPVRSKSVKLKKITPKSEKRIIADKKYGKLRKIFIQEFPNCQIHSIEAECTGISTQVHHKYSGKDRSKHYLEVETWISTCHNCHTWVHTNSLQARELNLLK